MKKYLQIAKYVKIPFVKVYFLLRVVSALLIFYNPVLGFLLTLFFDFWDGYFYEMLPNLVEMPRPLYQKFDKLQDWFAYTCMWFVSYDSNYFGLITAAILFRLFGQIIFMIFDNQKVFVYFPNFIEIFFLWFVVFQLMDITLPFYFFYFFIIFQLLREVILHIYWPNSLKKNGFPTFLRKYLKVRDNAIW